MIKQTLLLVCVLPAVLWAQTSAGIQKGEVLNAPRAANPSTGLLFPFVSTQNGYDSTITLSNTSQDTLGSSPQSGACTLRYLGAGASLPPSAPVSVAAGHSATIELSTVRPNFQGYVLASCSFPLARGGAQVSNNRSSFRQDAQVVDGPLAADSLLFPYVSNRNTDDTLLAIANTSNAAGSCDLNFYGANAPAKFITDPIAAGSVYSARLSSLAPAFQGYATANCNFQGAAGTGVIESLFGLHPSIAAAPEVLTASRPDPSDPLLFPAVSNRNGADTNLVIVNTGSQAGACTLNFQGANAPAAFRTAEIAAGSVYTAATSALAPGFDGFVLAQCDFPNSHGVAAVSASAIPSQLSSDARSSLLFPAVSNWNSGDTAFTISNTAARLGIAGACRISYFGDMADGGYTPAPQTSSAIRPGEQLTFSLSQGSSAFGIAGVPAFRGYAIADCDFPLARGTASFTSPLKTTAISMDASLPVASAGRPATERAGVATPKTTAPPSSYIASTLTGGLPVATAANPATFPLGTLALTNVATNGTNAVTTDGLGNVYFAIGQNSEASAVYKVDTNGVMTRVAGTGFVGFSGDGGPAINATLSHPAGLAIDASGNLYISDQNNERIRMVSTSGIITTIAGNGTAGSTGDSGPATSAELKTPTGLALDAAGNLYIADSGNFKVRMVSGGVITTVAGTGTAGSTGDGSPATSATLTNPLGVAVDASGNLYIADGLGHKVRKVTGGVISTYGGLNGVPVADGQPATATGIGSAVAVAVDNAGNVYVADAADEQVDLIQPGGLAYVVAGHQYLPVGSVHFAGDGGPALSAAFTYVNGVAVDAAGNLYISDGGNFRIRKVTGGIGGTISTFAGSGTVPYSGDGGPAALAQIGSGGMLAFDASGNLYASDPYGNIVRRFGTNGIVSTVAGTGVQGYSGDGGAATGAALNYPHGLAFDNAGNLYIADTYNYCVRQVTPGGTISTFAGVCTVAGAGGDGGPATSAHMTIPFGLTIDPAGNLYIADENNNSVRRVSTNGIISTFAGNGTAGSTGDNGPAVSAELNSPYVLASDAQGNIYVGENAGFRIRQIAVNGTITTYAGTGTNAATGNNGPATSAAIGAPTGMAIDSSGNLYIGDGKFFIHRVAGGIMTEIAGTGIQGYAGDGGPATSATFASIAGVGVDAQGNVYVGDGASGRSIRVMRPAGTQPVLTIAASPTGNFSAGQTGAAITLKVTNAANALATSGTVTVNAVLPADYTLVSIAGNNWSCTGASCTRTDGLGTGASYDTLTVTFNISPNATTQDTAYFMVSGGGAAGAATYNTANIGAAAPVLNIGTYHQGIAAAGQNNLALTVVVGNAITGAATNGVTVTDTLPSGLTLVSATGTGWNCNGASCSRSDSLAGGGIYPPITFTVDVAAGASAPLVNSVSVSDGGVSATATDSILATGQLTVLSVSSNSSTLAGNSLQPTVYFANLSGFTASGMTVNLLTLPSGYSYASATITVFSTNTTVQCSSASCTTSVAIPPGAYVEYTALATTSSSAATGTNLLFSMAISGAAVPTITVNQNWVVITPTPNISTSTPTVISSVPSTTTESFVSGGQSSLATCNTGLLPQTVYFQYTAAFTGTLTLNTFGSNYNTVIDVFNGTVATANSVGCTKGSNATSSDNNFSPTPSPLSVQVSAGTTYIILVGNSTTAANFHLILNLANATAAPVLNVSQSQSGSFTSGQQGTYNINVIPYEFPTSGTVTVAETLPPGLTLASMSGNGWTCTGLTCTRGDSLTVGTSYPITLVVNVASGTASSVTASVTASGGGATAQTVTDLTTISGGVNSNLPTLTVGPNFGNFSEGPIQIALSASGGSGTGYTYSITGGALPAGLAIRTDGGPSYFPAGTTAGIIGVATATVYSPPASFTITVTDSANNSVAVPCTMSIVPLAITDFNRFTDGTVGVAYSYTPTAAGNTGSVTWAAPNGGLPTGLSIASNGAISGTPSKAGTYNFNLAATDSTGTISYGYMIQIWGVGFSTAGDLGNAIVGSSFNVTLAGVSGTSPYTFSAASLPTGLSLTSAGVLSGTPTSGGGTFRFPVTITDSASDTYTKTFVLNIVSTPTLPSLGYPNPAEDLTLGESRQSSFSANNGMSPYTWSISSGSIPPGMRLVTTNLPTSAGPDDAILEGAPTQVGTFTFTLSLKDSSPTPITVAQPITLNVRAMTNDYPGTNPTIGKFYSFYIDPVGGTAPYTWTTTGGTLPNGLTLGSAGIISGTPLEDGNFTIFLNIGDSSGISLNRYLTLDVAGATTPQIAFNGPFTLPDGVVNTGYNANLSACCTSGLTVTPVGALPTGLTLSASGQLSGTPTVTGTYTIEAMANAGNNSGTAFFSLNISALTPSTPAPAAVVGTFYTTTFTVTGGTGTVAWVSLPGSDLPPGLTLAGNGTLSGIPASAGTFGIQYYVTDTGGHYFTGSVTISVYPAGTSSAPAITVPSNFGPNWTQGEIQYALTATGGNGTYTWSLASGALPTGLAIRTDTPAFFPAGTAAGLIGLATTPGNYTFTLAVTSGGVTSYQTSTWRITPLTLKDGALPQAFVGVPYSYTLTALNPQSASVTWTPTSSLPTGLSLSSAGVISGTPSQAGNSNISFNFTDGVDTDSRTLSISVSPIQILSTPALNLAANGSINMNLQASGGTGGYTWSASGLPNGLNLSTGGVLSGTISAPAGRNGFVVAVTDSSNESYAEEFSIVVIETPALYPSIALNNLDFNPITPVGMYASRIISVLDGGTAPFTWTVTGLPAGMSSRTYNQGSRLDLIPDDVEIYGTPTALGNYTVKFTVTDASGYSATLSTPFTVTALTVDGNDYLPNGALNTAYSSKLRVLGGTPPYTVSEVNTTFNALPDGLTLSAGNFTVSGTPLENGNFYPEFQFTDSAGGGGIGATGNSFVLLSGFNVSGGGLTIGTYFNLGDAYTGSTYSNTLSACCAASYNWTIAGGALPSGLTLSSAGVLSGTATPTGVYTFLVKVAQPNSANVGYKQFVLTVTPLGITSNGVVLSGPITLPNGTVNTAYSSQIQVSEAASSSFTLGIENPLPPGLALGSTGVISGTPTATGQFLFDVLINDGNGHSTVGYFDLSIYPSSGSPLGITTGANLGTVPLGEVQIPLSATGGSSGSGASGGGFTWSVTSGSLPPGLSLRTDKPTSFPSSASAGIIGVATNAQTTPYSFTLTVTSGTQSVSQAFTLKVTGLTAMENSGYRLADAFVGSGFSYQLSASGNAGTVTWSAPTGLPSGITLSSAGLLSGTPASASAGSYAIGFSINDTVDTVTTTVDLTVNPIQISNSGNIPGMLSSATQGTAYTTTLSASGGTSPYTFTSGTLPAGLSLTSAGVISGTPTAGPGRYAFNVTATDSSVSKHSYTQFTSLVIIGVPATQAYLLPYGNFDDCSVGMTCSRGINAINGGTPPFAYSVTGLPAGMNFRSGQGITPNSIAPGDVELWGAPTAAGIFNVQVTMTDANGAASTQIFPLHVSNLYVDPNDELPNGTINTGYAKLLRVLGGTPSTGPSGILYTAKLNEGVLPDGLTLSGMTVSGTPLENGAFSPQFLYTDSTTPANTLHITNSFTIANASGDSIVLNTYDYADTGSINDIIGYFTVNTAMSFTLSASPSATYTWAKTGGSLPTGVTLSSGGVLSGTPTAVGTYTFLVAASTGQGANGESGYRQYTIVITPLSIGTTSPLPDGTVDSAYSTSLTATGSASLTSSVTNEYLLPPGLSLTSAGVLSGTPTAPGQFIFYVQVSDGSGDLFYRQFSLTIFGVGQYPPLALSLGPNLGPYSIGVRNIQLAATGGKAPLTYSFTPSASVPPDYRIQNGGQLPPAFPTSVTGGLLGVLTAGSYSTSIRVTDANGTTLDHAITLTGTTLTILNGSNPPAAVAGTAYSFTFTASGGTGSYTWSASGLPAGLSIGSGTGTVSGTPTASGSPSATITVTDSTNTAVSVNYTFTVNAFAITTAQVLPPGAIGTAYPQTLSANCQSCAWSVVGGALPAGLSLTSAGAITGTPTTATVATFLVQASSSSGSVQREFTIVVPYNTPQPLYITNNPNFYSVTLGNSAAQALGVQGGTPPYTWSLASGTLPPGMTLVTAGETYGFNYLPGFGYLAGKATALGNYSFTLQVTDAAQNTTSQAFTWNVTPLNFNMTTFPINGTAGTYGALTPTPTLGAAYSQQILLLGGSGNYVSWTTPLSTNLLPPGLSLNSTTGVVSGTPASTGSYSTLVQVNDDGGNTIEQFITFNVISSTSTTIGIGLGPNLGSVAAGGSYVFNIAPSGGTAPYTITAVSSLPPGCALETGSALLGNASGTYDLVCAPLAGGLFTFALEAADSAGNIGQKQMTITFAPQYLFSDDVLADGAVGTPYSQLLVTYDNAGTVTWAVAPGSALPPGLTLNGATISGTPTTAGSYSFVLSETDSVSGATISYTFTVTISTITITNPAVLPVQATYLMPFSYPLTTTGGGPSQTFSASGLPVGLSMSSAGLISGTPTQTGSFNVGVTVTDGSSTQFQRFGLFVYYPELMSYSPASTRLADVRVGQAMTIGLSPAGGVAPFTWALASGSSLPSGLSLLSGAQLASNSLPGITILGGQPSAAGRYSFSLVVTDSTGATLTVPFSLNVSAISIEAGSLPNGTLSTAYSRQLTAAGGTAPYTFAATAAVVNPPILPPGLSLSTSGLISGTPSSTGAYKFNVTATDSASNTYTTTYTLTVLSASGLDITSYTPVGLSAGLAFNGQLAISGSSTYTWSITSGTLPAGVSLSSSGLVSGAASMPGNYTVNVHAVDKNNSANTADRQYVLAISRIQINHLGLPPVGTIGSAYSYQFSVAGGTAPYTFSTVPAEPLPAGLTLSPSGLLSGTPTLGGEYAVYANVSDSLGNTGVVIESPFAFVQPGQNVPMIGQSVTTHDASYGVPYVLSSAASGTSIDAAWVIFGAAPISYAVAPGSSLPAGMSIVPASNGVPAFLGGIPHNTGVFNYSLIATDANGQTATVQLTTTLGPTTVTPALAPAGTVGAAYSMTITASHGSSPYTFGTAPGSDMPPGLSLTSAGVLSGTPTLAGTFNVAVQVTDSDHPPIVMTYNYQIVIDTPTGSAPGIGISDANTIQISYVRTTPAPAAYPISVSATSGSIPFSATIDGIPALSLSANSGTASTTVGLTINPSGLTSGVYNGIFGVLAPTSDNYSLGIPVVLTVLDPPVCSYAVVPAAGTVAAAGGTASFEVSTGPLCSWTATASDPTFITVNPASASGTGEASVQYTLSANTGSSARTGSISVNGASYSITQFGSGCALAITPATVSATYAGGTATVNVQTTNSSCAWTATGLGAAPASGTGNGTVTFTIPPNATTSPVVLNATVQLSGGGSAAPFTVNQNGSNCTVSLSASVGSLSYTGGEGQVNVSTPAGCAYSSLSGPAWLTITSGASGSGPGPVALTYSATPNSSTTPRIGTMTIGDQAFAVEQASTPCSITIDTSALASPFGPNPQSVYLNITTNGSNCSWQGSSPVTWASVIPTYGSGNGTVQLSVLNNTLSTSARTTNINIGGTSVTVVQDGTSCSYSLASQSASVPYTGGIGKVLVSAPTVCTWTAQPDPTAPWLTLQNTNGGNTQGTNLGFVAAANATPTQRSGTLTIAGLPFTVTQGPGPCSYTLSPSGSSSAPAGGTSGSFNYSTTSLGCTATPVSNTSWLTATASGGSNGSSGTVSFTAAANPNGVTRAGAIQIGASTYTVTEAAATCSYTLQTTGASFGQAGGTGTVVVTAVGGCTPQTGVSGNLGAAPAVVLGQVTSNGNVYTLPYTVAPFSSATSSVRTFQILFGNISAGAGNFFEVKQTSY